MHVLGCPNGSGRRRPTSAEPVRHELASGEKSSQCNLFGAVSAIFSGRKPSLHNQLATRIMLPASNERQDYALLMPAISSLSAPQKTWAVGSHRLAVFALVLVVVLLGAVSFLIFRWPFSRTVVVSELEEESFSKVSVGAFHGTYFPHPGCVLEHVIFQHNPKAGTPPLVTVDTIRIEGSFSGLFRRHVGRVVAEGMHVLVPAKATGEPFETPQRPTVEIDELVANGAILEVASSDPDKKPLKFDFHEFTLSHAGGNGPASFAAKLSNPEPPGEISTTGKFGPWNADNVGGTPVSGEYVFEHADLGVFHGISGLLSSSGKFAGELDHIEVDGNTDVPLFAVTVSSHQVDLRTQFHAVVNGENGDTFLKQVASTFGKTTVWTAGSVAGEADQEGKTAALDLAAKDGRIQDLLLLFAQSPRAPMSGIASFNAKVSLPPGKRRFLEKVEMQGDFGIDAGSFTKSNTQQGVNSLSQGARGENQDKNKDKNKDGSDQETVLSDLKGHVELKNGTARFSNLSFSVPGALAQLQGTYNLLNEKIDLRGTLKTEAEVSKTTHGVRALMLKALDPFFKNKHREGYTAPVKISGTYEHPAFGLDMRDDANAKNHTAKMHTPKSLSAPKP
jgi:hypothetical protein